MNTSNNNSIINKILKNKKISIPVAIAIVLIGFYCGVSIFYNNKFNPGTIINGVEASGKTVSEVNKMIKEKIKNYSLEIEERGGKSEKISADDIDLELLDTDEVKNIEKNQSSFAWIKGLFKDSEYKISNDLTYNEEKLSEAINNLECISGEDIVAPKSAYLSYENSGYVIKKEELGNTLSKEKFEKTIKKSILSGNEKVDLEASKCYEAPKHNSNSKDLKKAQETLNSYMKAKITYSFAGKSDTVDKNTINTWIDIDEDYNISINPDKVRIYVDKLAGMFNTYGSTRSFKTSEGNTVNISTGDYGWIVNKSSVIEEIINNVKNGQTVELKPTFSQQAASETGADYGNSYVEINLASQHLWLYKDGSCIFDTDVVSGTANDPSCKTPDGVYYIKYKEKDATLRGEGYETPVSYWMPFNNNIGMHDATWRSEFGGNIYLNGGSHGCVNLPIQAAQTIFDTINAGYPVICYYDYSTENTNKDNGDNQGEKTEGQE